MFLCIECDLASVQMSSVVYLHAMWNFGRVVSKIENEHLWSTESDNKCVGH